MNELELLRQENQWLKDIVRRLNDANEKLERFIANNGTVEEVNNVDNPSSN